MTDLPTPGPFEPPRGDMPAPAGPPLLPPSAPVVPPPPGLDAAAEATVVAAEPKRRSRGKMVGAVVAAAALVGAGAFAVVTVVGGSEGGAASPQEAGEKFMAALEREDVLGLVDVLLPGERAVMRQPMIDIVDNLKRLEVLDGSATLDKVGGIDVKFSDVKVDAADTNVDDISNLHVTGSVAASVDGKAVPIGKLLIDEAFGGDRPDMDANPDDDDVDMRMAAVRDGGRWYVSAFYSIAENIRGAGGDDIPEKGITANGASSPEKAVQNMIDSVADLDLGDMIAALNPNEAAALQRYAPMFIDDAQQALRDSDITLRVQDSDMRVTGSGDRRTVVIDTLHVDASSGGQDATVEYADGCWTVTNVDGEQQKVCGAGGSFGDLGIDDPDGKLKRLIDTVNEAFSDIGEVGLTVQNVRGQWYLSPIGTVADVLVASLKALDKGELTDIIDAVREVMDAGTLGSVLPVGGDTASDDSTSDTFPSEDAYIVCQQLSDYQQFVDCLNEGLGNGSIDPLFVSPQFSHPECGVGEAYWNGAVYSMTDEEFVAFAESAAPCFQKLVADGTIQSYELPPELWKPECLEGHNYWTATDNDVIDRVYNCAAG